MIFTAYHSLLMEATSPDLMKTKRAECEGRWRAVTETGWPALSSEWEKTEWEGKSSPGARACCGRVEGRGRGEREGEGSERERERERRGKRGRRERGRDREEQGEGERENLRERGKGERLQRQYPQLCCLSFRSCKQAVGPTGLRESLGVPLLWNEHRSHLVNPYRVAFQVLWSQHARIIHPLTQNVHEVSGSGCLLALNSFFPGQFHSTNLQSLPKNPYING